MPLQSSFGNQPSVITMINPCAVFDTLMQKSIPAGYHVTNKTFAQLERDGYGKKPQAILVQTLAFNPT